MAGLKFWSNGLWNNQNKRKWIKVDHTIHKPFLRNQKAEKNKCILLARAVGEVYALNNCLNDILIDLTDNLPVKVDVHTNAKARQTKIKPPRLTWDHHTHLRLWDGCRALIWCHKTGVFYFYVLGGGNDHYGLREKNQSLLHNLEIIFVWKIYYSLTNQVNVV